MEKELEIAMIQASTATKDGRNIFWTLSRNQIEFILSETVQPPAGSEGADFPGIEYQSAMLPLFDLENYFGLEKREETLPERHVVVKTVSADGRLAKVVLRTRHPVRMRKLPSDAGPVQENIVSINTDDILGSFLQEDGHHLVIPDLASILQKQESP